MSGASCEVVITMAADTLTGLVESDYYLYAFTAVECADAATRPVLWQRTQGYSQSTVVRWTPAYQAYTATAAPPPERPVDVGFAAAMVPGQLLTVSQRTGVGAVSAGIAGEEAAVGILNRTTTQLQSGLSQAGAAGYAPVCTAPLYGGALQLFAPVPMVLLLMSPQPAPPGSVVTVATGPGMMIDVGGAGQRAVAFDINTGWSWADATWGWSVPAGSELTPLLVRRPSPQDPDATAGSAPA
ncbi:MAG TPA: hypothetical protein VHG08_20590 [Longimicrobium sp.]|nr:hypothetical protein [Longimicrobium sp.]